MLGNLSVIQDELTRDYSKLTLLRRSTVCPRSRLLYPLRSKLLWQGSQSSIIAQNVAAPRSSDVNSLAVMFSVCKNLLVVRAYNRHHYMMKPVLWPNICALFPLARQFLPPARCTDTHPAALAKIQYSVRRRISVGPMAVKCRPPQTSEKTPEACRMYARPYSYDAL